MTLARRVVAENRAFIVPLVLALLANIAAYVYPLRVKSETAADRAATAGQALDAAKRDGAAAQALVTGKTQADQELAVFYQKVLPPDVATARRITYTRVPDLARKANVKYDQRSSEVDQREKNIRLGRLRTRVVLEGDYEGLRQFIFELETTPEFIIIDDVTLAQAETNRPLTLTVELSTYYRLGANGA
jgi:hypothetical protein